MDFTPKISESAVEAPFNALICLHKGLWYACLLMWQNEQTCFNFYLYSQLIGEIEQVT